MRWLFRASPPGVPDYHAFSPPLLRIEASPPHPLGRAVLWSLLALLAFVFVWALVGRLEIVAVADGRLVPQGYLKIVQPADAGIVREILVAEGERVRAGQVLMRMDGLLTEADAQAIEAEFARKRLALRRIDAELSGQPFAALPADPPALAAEVGAQYRANRAAVAAARAEAESRLARARAELAAALQGRDRLEEVLPHYRTQDEAFAKLRQDGFAGPLLAGDKRRERVEKEQELKSQLHLIDSARAGIVQLENALAQLDTDDRRQLHAERAATRADLDRLTQERAKQSHRRQLLELKAGGDSVVKDLATHSVGTVVQPGTVLLTLVPVDEALRAEVWVDHADIGFVRAGQPVRIKLAAFRFQKYGMVEGVVEQVSVDAAEPAAGDAVAGRRSPGYKALVALASNRLQAAGESFPLAAGMQASAEILLGTRSVAEYLLSPVSGAWHEAGRER